MKKDRLPVSRKFYNDITLRINEALSTVPSSAVEAMRVVEHYMSGKDPESDDPMAMLAFNMIKTEIERAMSRSKRARERAATRKNVARAVSCETESHSSAEPVADSAPVTDQEPAPERPMNRRERRAAQNLVRRLKRRRWGAIA